MAKLTSIHRAEEDASLDAAQEAADLLQASFSDFADAPFAGPINARELTSIEALLAYVAYNQEVNQDTVQTVVETHFGVDKVADLKRNDYMRAIEFLVDLKLDEVIN